MIIIWKDPNMRLHGKRHKSDRYYFRWHYGKQRRVYITKEYVDKPTERQISAREAFTELRREVARQLRDAELHSAWMRKFEEDNEGYKMLHTYVYAKLKAPSDSVRLDQHKKGERCVVDDTETTKDARTSMRRGNALVSTSRTEQKFRSAEVRRFGRGERDAINGVSTPIPQEHDQHIYNLLPILGNKGDGPRRSAVKKGVSTRIVRQGEKPIIMVWNGVIVPLFLPWKVPKRECLRV